MALNYKLDAYLSFAHINGFQCRFNPSHFLCKFFWITWEKKFRVFFFGKFENISKFNPKDELHTYTSGDVIFTGFFCEDIDKCSKTGHVELLKLKKLLKMFRMTYYSSYISTSVWSESDSFEVREYNLLLKWRKQVYLQVWIEIYRNNIMNNHAT